MNGMYVVPNAVRRAGTEVIEIASRIHITSSEDKVRVSNDQPAGTNLDAAAERAANVLVKACTTFSKRLDNHSEALVHAVSATESQDQNSGRSFFRPQDSNNARLV